MCFLFGTDTLLECIGIAKYIVCSNHFIYIIIIIFIVCSYRPCSSLKIITIKMLNCDYFRFLINNVV